MATEKEIERVSRQFLSPSLYDPLILEFLSNRQGMAALFRMLIKSREPLTSRDLQDILHVSSARTAVMVRRLEEKGVIEKKPNPKDRRAYFLVPTQKGLEIAHKREEDLNRLFGRMIDEIGYDRLEEFFSIMHDLTHVTARLLEEHRPENEDDLCHELIKNRTE